MAKVTKVESFINTYMGYVDDTDLVITVFPDSVESEFTFSFKGHLFKLYFVEFLLDSFYYTHILISVDNNKRSYSYKKRSRLKLQDIILNSLYSIFSIYLDVPF